METMTTPAFTKADLDAVQRLTDLMAYRYDDSAEWWSDVVDGAYPYLGVSVPRWSRDDVTVCWFVTKSPMGFWEVTAEHRDNKRIGFSVVSPAAAIEDALRAFAQRSEATHTRLLVAA